MSPEIALPQSHRDKSLWKPRGIGCTTPTNGLRVAPARSQRSRKIVKERDVSIGLRRTLVTQANRLQRLASERYEETKKAVPAEELQRETVGSEEVNGGQDVDK